MHERNGEIIDSTFVIRSLSTSRVLTHYERAVDRIGLWNSEAEVCKRYFTLDGTLLDIGCGAGRTTLGLYEVGFENIIGIDVVPRMIESAIDNAIRRGLRMDFRVGDACHFEFHDATFDGALFSFNGLMMIPGHGRRRTALMEIRRVLRCGGTCIFTTPLRRSNVSFWRTQRRLWTNRKNDMRLFDFGDVITNGGEFRDTYLRFPTLVEVRKLIRDVGFTLIDTFDLGQRFEETEHVHAFAGDCVFWIIRK